jgi:hypothetical protein
MVGMRLSALHLPLLPGANLFFRDGVVVVGKARAHGRRENGSRLRVIASVREAIQLACAGSWIASSLSLLAMTTIYPPKRVSAGEGDRPKGGGGGRLAPSEQSLAPNGALSRATSPARGGG